MLPTFLMEGPLVWPGQHAGFLGPRTTPGRSARTRTGPTSGSTTWRLPDGFSVERLERRRDLLDSIEAGRRLEAKAELAAATSAQADPFADQRDLAYSLLLSGKVARAFDLDREDPRVRDRYGRHMFGQSLLLARRLVQAGVPIVQVNMGRVQTWDTHSGNFKSLKNRLLPPTDQGVSALLDDLAATGPARRDAGRRHRRVRPDAPDRREHRQQQRPATAATTGRRSSRRSSPAPASAAARRSASPTATAPTPPAVPYTPADLAATIYRPSASTPRPSSTTASTARSASATAADRAALLRQRRR